MKSPPTVNSRTRLIPSFDITPFINCSMFSKIFGRFRCRTTRYWGRAR